MRFTPNPNHGTHLSALIRVVNLTEGPILELGTGLFSTPYLHAVCFEKKRKLVSYDNQIDFVNLWEPYKCDYHKIYLIDDWDKIDISGHWSVVLVDHHPNERRKEEVKRLANNADFIVVHDTEGAWEAKYEYSEIYPLFKYRRDFKSERPFTTVLSNFKDLSNL